MDSWFFLGWRSKQCIWSTTDNGALIIWVIQKIFVLSLYWICYDRVSILCFAFWPRGVQDLSSPTRTEPVLPALEVLITGPPGKSPEDSHLSSLTWLLAGGDRERRETGREREEERERARERSCRVFYKRIGGAPYHHLCHILLVVRTNPWYNKGGGWLHESARTGSRIAGDHLW